MSPQPSSSVSLAERLGYGPTERIVIVNADGLGMSQSVNAGVYDGLRHGIASSASLMVPCPWARHAVSMYDGDDVGVHLTLNCEFDLYRWGPVTQAPSLLDGDGGLPRTVEDTWDHADLDEVRRECRSQVERAMQWGVDVTHLDSHLSAMQLRPEFFDIYLDLALEFRLPLRMAPKSTQSLAGFPFRDLAEAEGVWFPDRLVFAASSNAEGELSDAVRSLPAGVTELCLHPAVPSAELDAFDPRAADRVANLAALQPHSVLADALRDIGATVIGWRSVRDAMRAGAAR